MNQSSIRPNELTTARMPATAAAMANPESKALVVAGAAAIGRFAAAGAAAGLLAAATGAAPPGRGWGMPGADSAGAPVGGAMLLILGAPGLPAGPPGGSVGNLMVGAAVGFGGRLMRTVSFLGCTFPVSFLGGKAPVGAPGMFGMLGVLSDINLGRKLKSVRAAVNL